MKSSTSLLILLLALFAGCREGAKQGDTQSSGERFPPTILKLNTTDDFTFSDPQHTNWSIAGEVYANRNQEGHIEWSPGSGILVNHPDSVNHAELLSRFEHGDLDLELDFMMAKNSNSGIYLQGRYELQLLDSWQKDPVEFGDNGGIYARMVDNVLQDGHPPLANASKAPGLWQHLKIRFRAPRFDAAGNKTENARFKEVYLNGTLVQQDAEIGGPTRSAVFSDEKPTGPLVIQGSHGAAAFRNIKYRSYISERIALADMQVKVYKSFYPNVDTLKELSPDRVLAVDTLSQLSYESSEQAVHTGKMIVPVAGEYSFMLRGGGPTWLTIDSVAFLNNDTTDNYNNIKYGTIHLEAGAHPFTLIYNKRYNSMDLGYESAQIPFTFLTTVNSGWVRPATKPYIIEVGNEAIVQRGFMMHDTAKRTHAIAVGFPGGVNYGYSLSNFSLLNAWHGSFVDAAEMWRDRGEPQLEHPLGALIALTATPTLQAPAKEKGGWRLAVTPGDSTFTSSGYSLTKNQEPVFFYTFRGTAVRDYIHPAADKRSLTRELEFSFSSDATPFRCVIADGSKVRQLDDGSYVVNDYGYYVDDINCNGCTPEIIKTENGYALVTTITPTGQVTTLRYNIIW